MSMGKALFLAAGLALAAGCGDSGSGEAPSFGSATDIRQEGQHRTTNAANEADNGVGGPVQRQTGNYQAQPAPGQASDDELARKVKVALTTGSMGTTGVIAENQLTKIEVKAQNGVITLQGAVSSEEEKNSIEKQVAGMKGVRSVRNELTVGGRDRESQPTDSLVPRGPGTE